MHGMSSPNKFNFWNYYARYEVSFDSLDFMIYLIFDSSNEITVLKLSRIVGIYVKSATINSRKTNML